jgi:hypothetical protein
LTAYELKLKCFFLQIDGTSRVEFNKDKGVVVIFDKSGKVRLVYSAPVVRLPAGKTIVPNLEWDSSSSSISIALPDLSFPLVIAFGLGVKIPDIKGGFHLAFPSFKFGAKGEIEDSGSESEEEEKKKKSGGFGFGIKAPKIGFGHKDKAEVAVDKPELAASTSGEITAEKSGKHKVFAVRWGVSKIFTFFFSHSLDYPHSRSSSHTSNSDLHGPNHSTEIWMPLY